MVVNWSEEWFFDEGEESPVQDAASRRREIERNFQLVEAEAPDGDVDVVERLVARCDAFSALHRGQSVPAKHEQLVCGVSRYLQHVEALGVVSGVILGWEPDKQPGGYLWNVLREPYRPGQGSRPAFQQLNRLTSTLESDLSGVIGLAIAHVSPEHVSELLRRCELQGIDTRHLSFDALARR